jgi:hypothetical protein
MGGISVVGPLRFNNAAVFMAGSQNEDSGFCAGSPNSSTFSSRGSSMGSLRFFYLFGILHLGTIPRSRSNGTAEQPSDGGMLRKLDGKLPISLIQ